MTRRALFVLGSHTMVVTCVRWGGEGLIYSASRDCSINVWDAQLGRLLRTLKGHGHWVNTLALSTEHALRTGAHDHTGAAPDDATEAMEVCVFTPSLSLSPLPPSKCILLLSLLLYPPKGGRGVGACSQRHLWPAA